MLRRFQPVIVINERRTSRKVPTILVRFESNLNFLYRFAKNTQIQNFIKARPIGADFHADRQT